MGYHGRTCDCSTCSGSLTIPSLKDLEGQGTYSATIPGVSVLRKGRVMIKVAKDTAPGDMVTMNLDALSREQDEMLSRMNEEYLRQLYPAELPKRVHTFLDALPAPAKKPLVTRLRDKLAVVSYPLRARLASLLVGRDVDADSDADPDDDSGDY